MQPKRTGNLSWRGRICLFFGVPLLVCFLTGCGKRETHVKAGDRRQIFYQGNGGEPQELDPHIVTGVSEQRILMTMLEGLLSQDPVDLHPVPGVAERWDISPDGKTYTFYLRRNAKWSNGDPVTAHDFWESYRRLLTPSLAAEYSYMLFPVKNARAYNEGKITDFNQVGFKVLDDYTFEITLESSTPYLLSVINYHSSWMPVHLPTLRKYGDPYMRGSKWTRAGRFVGNGPFVLAKWRVNDVIVVEKNPTYWDRDHVRLNAIHFLPIESDETEERAFRAGQLHVTETLPLTKIDFYRKNYP
ncbi:MAG: peptide ABC transporter substrate-binding protein, partial [Verrucomicrobiia bacterium]